MMSDEPPITIQRARELLGPDDANLSDGEVVEMIWEFSLLANSMFDEIMVDWAKYGREEMYRQIEWARTHKRQGRIPNEELAAERARREEAALRLKEKRSGISA